MTEVNAAAQTETPDPKKAAGLAKFLQDEAEVIWALASDEKDKMDARRLLDASYIVAAYPSALAQLRQAREQVEKALACFSVMPEATPHDKKGGIWHTWTDGCNYLKSALTTTAPKEKET